MHFDEFISEERSLLALIAILSSMGAIIGIFEWLILGKHFKDEGLYSWRVRKLRTIQFVPIISKNLLEYIFSYPNIIYFNIFRIILMSGLFLLINHPLLFGVLCLVLVGLNVILSIRGTEGTTGADQMYTITLLIVGLCIISPLKILWQAGLIFLTFQLILAYSTSGWIRILQPTWRSGEDLLVVLRQHTYGNKFVWNLGKRNPLMVKYISLFILTFECLSAVVLFMPMKIVTAFLIIGFLFHISNAVIMGLNLFIWSFIPLYVGYYWCAYQLNVIFYRI